MSGHFADDAHISNSSECGSEHPARQRVLRRRSRLSKRLNWSLWHISLHLTFTHSFYFFFCLARTLLLLRCSYSVQACFYSVGLIIAGSTDKWSSSVWDGDRWLGLMLDWRWNSLHEAGEDGEIPSGWKEKLLNEIVQCVFTLILVLHWENMSQESTSFIVWQYRQLCFGFEVLVISLVAVICCLVIKVGGTMCHMTVSS